jgi:hypothetical protein
MPSLLPAILGVSLAFAGADPSVLNLGLAQADFLRLSGSVLERAEQAEKSGCFSEQSARDLWKQVGSAERAVRAKVTGQLDGVTAHSAVPVTGEGEACRTFREVRDSVREKAQFFEKALPDLDQAATSQAKVGKILDHIDGYISTDFACALEAGRLETDLRYLVRDLGASILTVRAAFEEKARQLGEHATKMEGLLSRCGEGDAGKRAAAASQGQGSSIPRGRGARPGAGASDITGVHKALEEKAAGDKVTEGTPR